MSLRKLGAGTGWMAPCLLSLGLWTGPAAADVHVAVAGPIKGQFAAFGAQMLAGAERAVADINAAGGINGETLVLDAVDDGCDAEKAVAVANQLVGRGVVFVAGHFCFAASIAASEVYAGADIIQMSPATTLPKFTDDRPGPGVFRLAPRDDAQGARLALLLAEEFADARIALLHDKTAYGKGLVDAVKAEMTGLDLNDVLSLGFDAGGDNYRTLVTQLALENVDAVVFGGYHPEAGLIRLEMSRQGLDAVLISGDALMSEDYWSVAGPAGEGTLLTYPEIPRDMADAQSLVTALEEDGQPANRYVLTTYAAVQAFAQAAAEAGSTDPDAVGPVLAGGRFDTVLGPLEFDASGDSNIPAYAVYVWQGGAVSRR